MMIPKVDLTLQFYVIVAGLLALAIFGLPAAIRVWNDTRHGVVEETDTPEELLTPLEAAFRSGQMTEEEYQRIQQSVERVVAPSETIERQKPGDSMPFRPKPKAMDESAKPNGEPWDDMLDV